MKNFRSYGIKSSTMAILGGHGLTLAIAPTKEVQSPNPSIYEVNLTPSDILKANNAKDLSEVAENDVYKAISHLVQKKLDGLYGKNGNQKPRDCIIVPYYDVGVSNPYLTGDTSLNTTSLTIKGVVVIDNHTVLAANRIRKQNSLNEYALADFIGMAKKHIEYLDNLANERYLSVVVKTNGRDSTSNTRHKLASSEHENEDNAYLSFGNAPDQDGLRAKTYGTLFVYSAEQAEALNSQVAKMAYSLISDIENYGHKVKLKYDPRKLIGVSKTESYTWPLTQYIVTQVYHTFGFLMAVSSVSIDNDSEATMIVDMHSIPSNAWLMHYAKVPMCEKIVAKRTDSVGGRADFDLVTMSIILDQVMGIDVMSVERSNPIMKACVLS